MREKYRKELLLKAEELVQSTKDILIATVCDEAIEVASELQEIIKNSFLKEEKKEIPFVPKRGDFVYCENKKNGANEMFYGIYAGEDNTDDRKVDFYCSIDNVCSSKMDDLTENDFWLCEPIRLLTDQEKQLLIDKLHEAGKDWNEEKMEIVDWKWRAEKGGRYYFYSSMNDCLATNIDFYCKQDNSMFKSGNYFRTESEAQKFQEHCKSYFK